MFKRRRENPALFLTQEIFLGHFPPIHCTREEFSRILKVAYKVPQTLAEIFSFVPGRNGKPVLHALDKRYLLREQILDLFYSTLITNRQAYLTNIYQAYFAFKDPLTLDWSDRKDILTDRSISVQKNDASKRLIRNLFYLDILDRTHISNTVKSKVSFWQSLLNMFNGLCLEDRFFATSSLELCLKDSRNLFYLFQAYQPKASIFNPYTIKWILSALVNQRLGYEGKTLFTPVLSWSAYLIAFMHSTYETYVGVDVMSSVCEKNRDLADYYRQSHPNRDVTIICKPSERLLTDVPFNTRYTDFFDTIMVCPPYFNMEIYSEGLQSTLVYPDYPTWLEGYWRPTVEMCYAVTKPGGVFLLIINDFTDLTGHHYNLVQDLDEIMRTFYQYTDTFYLKNRTSPLRTTTKDRTEKLLLYTKLK